MKRGLIAALAIAASLTGCLKEEKIEPESGRVVKCTFTTGISQGSKSILSTDGIENRITDLMIAVYRGRKLFYHHYWSSAPETVELLLQEGIAFQIYAMANMGDYSSSLPSDEDGMEYLPYIIPSYESIDIKGFPMSRTFRYRPGKSVNNTILLERLFARVTVNMDCKWPGGRIVSAKLGNINSNLKPFGSSAIAVPSEDVYSGTPECDTTEGTGVSVVLYVPENLQGTIEGISSPEDKTHDSNPDVNAIKDRLTYLEVEMVGDELYQGSIIYRNYLGNNATDSFDIERNTSYIWNIEYYENNLSKDEWKYENDLTDTRYLSSSTNIYVTPGQMVSLGDYLDSNMDLSSLRWAPVSTAGLGAIIQSPLNLNNLSLPSFIIRPNAAAGASFMVTVAPQNNAVDQLHKNITVNVRTALNLNMTLLGREEAYPYLSARFRSTSTLSSAKAVSLVGSLDLDISPSASTIAGLQSWDYGSDQEGYYLLLTVVPTLPGSYNGIATTSTEMERISFVTGSPQICFSKDIIQLDIRGYDSPVTVSLCDSDGNTLPDGFYYPQCTVDFSIEDNYKDHIYIGKDSDGGSGYQTTVNNYSVIFRGDTAMAGKVIPATATYTYPNGYSVSKKIDIAIGVF